MKEKLRVGVIGLSVGRWHINKYNDHPNGQVVAVADINEARAKDVGKECGITSCYADGEEMIRKEDLDIVSIATPNKFHCPLTIAALEAGCHVLCEKPMAMNAQEAERMVEVAKKVDRRIMINFSYRFDGQSWAMKKQVDSGVLGDIYFARTIWHRRRGIPGFGGWFGQKALAGGGPLIDLGVHRLDLALWFMGYPKPQWVMGTTYDHIASAKAKKEKKDFDVEDLAVALIRFENGASIALEASWAVNIKESEMMETRFLGTKGGLLQRNKDEGYAFEMEIFRESDGLQYDTRLHPPFPDGGSAMRHFVDCIINGEQHVAPGEEGLTVMRVLDAIYLSAERGEPVRVD